MKLQSILLGIFFIISCAPLSLLRKTSETIPGHFEGKAQISIASPDYNANFGADLYFTMDDSFHIKVHAPFGMDVGEVYIIRKRYLYLNHMDHQMMNGEVDDAVLEQVFQIPLSPQLLSRLPLISYFYSSGQLDSLIAPWKITETSKKGPYLSTIVLKRASRTIRMQFDEYKRIHHIPIAKKILVEDEYRQQKLKLTFSKIKKSRKFIAPLPKIPLHYRQLTI